MEQNLGVEAREQVRKLGRGQGPDDEAHLGQWQWQWEQRRKRMVRDWWGTKQEKLADYLCGTY